MNKDPTSKKKASVNENLPIFVSQERERNLEQTFINSTGNLDVLKNQKNLKKDLCGTC